MSLEIVLYYSYDDDDDDAGHLTIEYGEAYELTDTPEMEIQIKKIKQDYDRLFKDWSDWGKSPTEKPHIFKDSEQLLKG